MGSNIEEALGLCYLMRPLSLFIKVDGVTTPKRLYNVGVGYMDMLDQARVFLASFLCYRGFQLYIGSAMPNQLFRVHFTATQASLRLRRISLTP